MSKQKPPSPGQESARNPATTVEIPPSAKALANGRDLKDGLPPYTLYAIERSGETTSLKPIGFGTRNIYGGYSLWNGGKDPEHTVLLPRRMENSLNLILLLDKIHSATGAKEKAKRRSRDGEGHER